MSKEATGEDDLNSWSVRRLKDEMTNTFGKTDFSACIEKSDLVAKLKHLRAATAAPAATNSNAQQQHQQQSGSAGHVAAEPPSVVGSLTYGKTIYVGNTRNPTSCVILSHGLGDTGNGWADAARMMSQQLPQTLFVLPTAAQQSVTLNMGARTTSWYDIKGLVVGASEDVDGIQASAQRLQALMDYACGKYGIPHSKGVYAGFSQGGCISLVGGLLAPKTPAGILSMSSYLGARDFVKAQLEALPNVAEKKASLRIKMCHGVVDPLIRLDFGKASFSFLRDEIKINSSNLRFKEYPGLAHSANMEEINDAVTWMREVLGH